MRLQNGGFQELCKVCTGFLGFRGQGWDLGFRV